MAATPELGRGGTSFFATTADGAGNLRVGRVKGGAARAAGEAKEDVDRDATLAAYGTRVGGRRVCVEGGEAHGAPHGNNTNLSWGVVQAGRVGGSESNTTLA